MILGRRATLVASVVAVQNVAVNGLGRVCSIRLDFFTQDRNNGYAATFCGTCRRSLSPRDVYMRYHLRLLICDKHSTRSLAILGETVDELMGASAADLTDMASRSADPPATWGEILGHIADILVGRVMVFAGSALRNGYALSMQPATLGYSSSVVECMAMAGRQPEHQAGSMWDEREPMMCASDDELVLPPSNYPCEDAAGLIGHASQDSWAAAASPRDSNAHDAGGSAAMDEASEFADLIDGDWLEGMDADYIPSPAKTRPAPQPRPPVRPKNEAVRLLYAKKVPAASKKKVLAPPKL